MPAASLTRRSLYRTPRGGTLRKSTPRPKANGYRRQTSRIQDGLRLLKKGVGLLLTGVSVFLLVLGMSWGVLAAHRVVTTHAYFGLRLVEVTGNNRVSAGQIMEASDVGLGQNTLTLDMAHIRSKLLQDPWIAQVSVKRVLPDRLLINIVEREPSFLIKIGKTLHFAGSDGRPIAPMDAGRFVSLPVISIEEGIEGKYLDGMVRQIEERRLPFGMAEVAWIRFTAGGEALLSLTRSGLLVSLELEGIEENIRRLNLAWRDLEARGGLSTIAQVTVFGGKVLARSRTQPGTPVRGVG
jgi:cell division protein FtsQ